MLKVPGLVAGYRFEGNANDFSGNGNNGTVIGATLTTGKFGQGYSFVPATVDYITFGDSNIFSFGDGSSDTPFSITFWIKPNAIAGGLIAKSVTATNGEYYIIFSNNIMYFRLVDESTGGYRGKQSASGAFSTGIFTHVSITYNGNQSSTGIKIYKNAKELTCTDTNSGTYVAMENTTKELNIGRRGNLLYSGIIDEFLLFKKELSQPDIKRVMMGLHPFCV